MIDQAAFKKAWVLLCERFNKQYSSALLSAYYNTLSPKMTTEQFQLASQKIFEAREFFPRPSDFLEAALPDVNALALRQWEQVQKLMAADGGNLDEEAQRVVRMLGGESELRRTNLDNVPFVRREFLALYGDAATIARREAGERISAGPNTPKLAAASMKTGDLALIDIAPIPNDKKAAS